MPPTMTIKYSKPAILALRPRRYLCNLIRHLGSKYHLNTFGLTV